MRISAMKSRLVRFWSSGGGWRFFVPFLVGFFGTRLLIAWIRRHP